MMLKTVGFGGEMSINQIFFFFSGYYVLFAVNNDIGVFFIFLIISFLFPFPFFSVKETPACHTLIHI